MNTAAQNEFVAARLAAHAAGTQDVERDPLVQAALAARSRTAPVICPTDAAYVLPLDCWTKRQAI